MYVSHSFNTGHNLGVCLIFHKYLLSVGHDTCSISNIQFINNVGYLHLSSNIKSKQQKY